MANQDNKSPESELLGFLSGNPLLGSHLGQKEMDDLLSVLPSLAAPSANAVQAWTNTMMNYQRDALKLWMSPWANLSGQGSASVIEPSAEDRRFKDEDWKKNPVCNFLMQSYLLASRAMCETVDAAELDAHEKRVLSFYTRYAADALAPTNFAYTNPEVIRQAVETRGQSLVDGFKNLTEDLQSGAITTSDPSAFVLGENIAGTQGNVVFRNELIEVIQYKPLVEKVYQRPLVIVPPCVNKFYIFDLNERKSFVKHALEQGQNVFIISWRNATPEMGDLSWDDYIQKGVWTAFDVARDITGIKKINVLSWCIGGTMVVTALAAMSAAERRNIASATFLTTMIDFSDPGEVEVFIDQKQIDAYQNRLDTSGVLPGNDLSRAMAMLHANESIWHFVINNYLLGKTPPPFDVLHWNADTSNLPKAMYSFFVENMYYEDKLKVPGGVTVCGKPLNVADIDVPCCFISATEDHIVPWRSTFLAKQLIGDNVEFILTEGGHVSGTAINHPVKCRRSFWYGGTNGLDCDAWQASAQKQAGSWWEHWHAWLAEKSGNQIAAPQQLGNKEYQPMDAAPGTYVKEDVNQNG
ncbi:MAG: class I poly(R)-hydroxyalkanoic acid synthase [Neptuniibacter caesariensis]|uniref:Class I poly(R)-hydroxyalkanoic acid synthase n=1 Tax=Neptuniibacter caesariensis TaxID=207954 RepID=A0A2G6JB83_NEPCE|nr:MAG: class I poly(R)-hydroxyalkanoic acid synthase [Neptuniibacter caesariensis]